jgi:Tat protein translocase TatB subunit
VGSIGAPEVLVILVVALLVLGPNRLPDAARQVGRAVAEIRRMSSGMQAELRDAFNSPVDGTPAPTPTAPPGPSAGVEVAPPPTPSAGVEVAPPPTPTAANGKFRWSDLPPSQ